MPIPRAISDRALKKLYVAIKLLNAEAHECGDKKTALATARLSVPLWNALVDRGYTKVRWWW